MSATLNSNWLTSQLSRRYPLDDNASGMGDDGTALKDDVIADLRLRWPVELGQFAFVGGITVTATLVSVVILAADALDSAATFTPLASISVRQPATEFSYYALSPMQPGVGGFISFGDIKEAFSIRCSSPQQGLLAPKVAFPYAALPIAGIRKQGRADKLKDIVKLQGGNDIEVISGSRHIRGHAYDALIIRLKNDTTSTRNVLADYIGPCGARPESENCSRPGVQTLNGVSPDCDGNIEIEFEGLSAAVYTNCGTAGAGIAVESDLGIADVCPVQQTNPTQFAGDDACFFPSPHDSESFSITPPSESDSIFVPPPDPEICEELPFVECFDHGMHPSWLIAMGLYHFVDSDDDSTPCPTTLPCIDLYGELISGSSDCVVHKKAVALTDESRRTLLIWNDCGSRMSLGKRVTSRLKMRNGDNQNMGVVLNYRIDDPDKYPKDRYHLVDLNRNLSRFELRYYNGVTLLTENTLTLDVPYILDDWYEVQVTIQTTLTPGVIRIVATVRNITTPSWPAASFSVTTNKWGPDDGKFGIHTTKAIGHCGYWRIEDVGIGPVP